MLYDLLILGILIYAFLRGAMKGLVWQLAAIAAIVLCFFFAESASLLIAPHIGVEPPLNRWVAMLVLYFVFSFASFAVARILKEGIDKAKFNDLDRHFGALLGVVKGVLFSLVLTFFVVTIYGESRGYITQTYSGYYAAVIMDRLHPVMPAGLSEHLEPYIHNLDHDGLDLDHSHPGGNYQTIDFGSVFNGNQGSSSGSGDPFTSPFETPNTNIGTSNTDPLISFVKNLPPDLISDQLKNLMVNAVQNTAPEDRTELLSQLSTGVPALMEKVAKDWAKGKPKPPEANATAYNQMLDRIASMYAETEVARRAVRDEIDTALYGLPDPITVKTVEDWYADLFGFQSDPDTSTTINTPLNERIRRQLQKAGISLNMLSSKLQKQLSSKN